jgi:glycosyltransferase involved in cell wall biosynthesis
MPSAFLKELGYALKVVVREPSGKCALHLHYLQPPSDGPLVSCIMPSRGGVMPARFAIECFQRQSYVSRELVVVSKDPNTELEEYISRICDPKVRFAVVSGAKNVGDMRNQAIDMCRGELLCIWDDDDLCGLDRIHTQVDVLRATNSDAAFFLREMVWSPMEGRLAVSQKRLHEHTMLIKREAMQPYPSVVRGGDLTLVHELGRTARFAAIDDPAAYIYVYHGRNICDATHFENVFEHATLRFEGSEYHAKIRTFSCEYDIVAYERELAKP